jgi:PAS domain S-box-containing protein
MSATARERWSQDFPARFVPLSAWSARRLRLIGSALACLTLTLAILVVRDLNHRTLQVMAGEIRALDLAVAEEKSRYLQLLDQMLQRVQSQVTTLQIHTADEFGVRMAETETATYLATLLGNLPPGHGIGLFGADGEFLIGGRQETAKFNIANGQLFKTLRDQPDSSPGISIVEKTYYDSQRSLLIGRRLSAPDGTFLGVAMLVAPVSHLLAFYDVLNRQLPIAVTLLRRNGEVLVHYPLSASGPAVIPPSSPWYDLVAQGGGSYRSPAGHWNGLPTLVSVQPLQKFPLVMNISTHEEDVLAPFRGQAWNILAIGAGLSVVTMILFWTLARQIQIRESHTATLEKTGAALRASEIRLRDFAGMASDWFWELNADLRLSWISLASPRLDAGGSPLIDEQRWEYPDISSAPEKWAPHRRDLLERRPFDDVRYEQARRDGATRHFSITGRPLFDHAGAFLGYRGIGRHITGQIKMERDRDDARDRAERAEVLLRDGLDSMSESVIVWDAQDRLVLINDGYRRRYPAHDLDSQIGLTFEEIIRGQLAAGDFPEAEAAPDTWLASRVRHHRSATGGFDRVMPDGTWIWVTERRMRSGGTVTLHVDITEFKRTEIALRQSEERLDLAQEAAGIGTWELNLETNTMFWSRQMFRTRGLDPVQHTPVTGAAAAPARPDDVTKARLWLNDLRQGIRHGPIEEHISRPDGERRLLRLEGRAVADEHGIIHRIVGTSQDVTERQQIEQQLVQAQKMEAIGNLTGGMAHDFNNILSIIINNLELADQALGPEGEVQGLLSDALDAALRAADLTQRLLAFARRQALTFEPLDLNEIVSNLQRLLSRLLGENIQIILDLSPDLWSVNSDRAQVEASITNLAMNARDAMAKGGGLSITTSNQTLDAGYVARNPSARVGEYAVVTVTDSGMGMTPDVLTRIFEPFFTTKGTKGGTGLGLSMVFGFINQSRGHITVESKANAGTRISLFLPRADKGAVTPIKAPADVPEGRGERVLVVEDNALMRRAVGRQVASLGYHVVEAEGAHAALEILRHERVDLLFTDVIMPGEMDGVDLARLAQKTWPNLRLLLTSGFAGQRADSRMDSLRMARGILAKPYRRTELAQAVRLSLDT